MFEGRARASLVDGLDSCGTIDLAAFAAQRLTPDQRETVERHLDRCPDCRAIAVLLVVPPERLPARRLRRGDEVDHYTIERVLGVGGMGTVYAAEDRDLGRRVALKVLDRHVDDEDRTRDDGERLEREARALARLSHPNVVTVFGVGRFEGATYLSTEIVEGMTLKRWIVARRRPKRAVLDVLVSVAHALAATHEAGLVHRDVKPDNVVVGDDGVPKLIDFGLARRASAGPLPSAGAGSKSATTPAGTLAYMAPEQHRTTGDARSDQYALCVTIAECLALAEVRPTRRLRDAVAVGRSEDPSDRFADLQPLIAGLERAAAGPRRRATLIGLGLLSAVSIVIARALLPAPDVDAAPTKTIVAAAASDDPLGAARHPDWLSEAIAAAEAQLQDGEAAAAEREARALLRRSEAEGIPSARLHGYRLLALALDHQERGDEAIVAIEQGLQAAEQANEPQATAQLWVQRAGIAAQTGDYDGAKRFADFADFVLAQGDALETPSGAAVLEFRGELLRRQGDLAGAREALERAHALNQRFEAEPLARAMADYQLGRLLLESDDVAERDRGHALVEDAFADGAGLPTPHHHTLAVMAAALASEARERGAIEDAAVWIDRAIAHAAEEFGPDAPTVARLQTNRAVVWRDLAGGELEARLELERLYRELSSSLGDTHPGVAVISIHLGRIAMDGERFEDAAVAMGRVLAIRESIYGPDDAMLIEPLQALETCERRLGHPRRAAALAARLARLTASESSKDSARPD